jgi:hypothetical protein
MLLSSLFDDPHSGLAEVLAWFFSLDSVVDGGTPSFRVDQPLAVLYRLLFVSLT